MGLAGQLRRWSELPEGTAHLVPSAAFLTHRFSTLKALRRFFHAGELCEVLTLSEEKQSRLFRLRQTTQTVPEFFTTVDSDALIESSFRGQFGEPIAATLLALQAAIAELNAVTLA